MVRRNGSPAATEGVPYRYARAASSRLCVRCGAVMDDEHGERYTRPGGKTTTILVMRCPTCKSRKRLAWEEMK